VLFRSGGKIHYHATHMNADTAHVWVLIWIAWGIAPSDCKPIGNVVNP
jgi:hypothetical protein